MMRLIMLLITILLAYPANAQDENFYYVHNDHNGTPIMLTDENQHVVWKAHYTPYGEAIIEIEEIEFPIRGPGQYYDKESGLHHNYYRDLNTRRGSYEQVDPRGQLLDFSDPQRQVAARMGIKIPVQEKGNSLNNVYSYASSNPIMHSDPTGEDPLTIGLVLWGIAYYNEAGDEITNADGNILDGFDKQDGRCSLSLLSSLGDACIPERCKKHDECYAENSCNWSSWGASALGGTKSCNQCNSKFFK